MDDEEEAYLQLYLQHRGRAVVTVDNEHVVLAQEARRVSADEIEETVRGGRLRRDKCYPFPDRPYDKVCVYRYFGKSRRTVEVILLFDREYHQVDVMTVWSHQERKEDPVQCMAESNPVRCLECRREMELSRLHDEESHVEYDGYRCPICGRTMLTLDQMRNYNAARDLSRAVPKRRKIVRVGSSLGFTLPSSVAGAGVSIGQEIEITVVDARHLRIELLHPANDPKPSRKNRAGRRSDRGRRAA